MGQEWWTEGLGISSILTADTVLNNRGYGFLNLFIHPAGLLDSEFFEPVAEKFDQIKCPGSDLFNLPFLASKEPECGEAALLINSLTQLFEQIVQGYTCSAEREDLQFLDRSISYISLNLLLKHGARQVFLFSTSGLEKSWLLFVQNDISHDSVFFRDLAL